MKVSSTLSCCPCSWPYFLTLSYISGRKDRSMDETVKPASLSLNAVGQSLLTSQASPVCVNTPSDAGESLKSPNMSTDSGFEGENNRPLLLTTMSSPSKDGILNSWSSDVFCRGKEALHFDGSDLTSLKSPKKSTDDSDFNESPFDKKSVPGASDAHSESDNEFGSEHNCTFFAAEPSWSETGTPLKEHFCVEGNVGVLTSQISAFSVCLRSHCAPDEKCETKNKKNNVEIGKCPSCHKLNFISTEDPADPTRCPSDLKWSGRLASIHEDKDCVIYAENDIGTNSEDDYDLHCKPDTETESSDEKMFDGAYSDETLSAYYVPSAVSVTTEDYQQPSNVIKEKVLVVEMDENSSEDGSGSLCLCHIGMCKSSRCQNERSRYTTILKPKAVRPSANPNRVDYHSSLESLQGQHVIAAIGQHRNRLSAFHERPASSLSQNESMQYFFSRSLDMPPISSSVRQASSPLSMGSAAGFVSSNPHIFSEPHNDLCSLSNVNSRIGTGHSRKSNCSDSHSSSNLERKGSKCKSSEDNKLSQEGGSAKEAVKSPRVKRFSMPWELFWKNESCRHESMNLSNEPIHMTLEEVHNSLQILSPHSTSESSTSSSKSEPQNVVGKHSSSGLLGSYLRQKKSKKEEKQQSSQQAKSSSSSDSKYQRKSFPVFIKSAFSNLFGLKKHPALDSRFSNSHSEDELSTHTVNHRSSPNTSPFSNRALPPLPVSGISEWEALEEEDPWTFDSSQSQLGDKDSEPEDFVRRQMDYAASIEKVKDCGWYWGPISGETAEKLLSGEPDGSFVVRDSSDEHYIFSLTFKLNGLVRHVRIEHDHGNFSFGCLQKFRSNTIVDFIDSAVAHSRSGRYLFFLHRRPILGPMRVQLLHPVSRFKQVQSLQHLCRFIILKTLRRDLIDHLPLPRRLKDYLNTPHYYSEELATLSLLNKKHPENRATCRRSCQPESSSTTTTRNESAPSSSNPPTSNG